MRRRGRRVRRRSDKGEEESEEGGGGKVELIDRNAFDGVDVAMMVHPSLANIICPQMLAIEQITINYHGRNAHAAGAPDQGINALDAVIQAFNNVSMMRQQFKPKWRVHGIITHGGDKVRDWWRAGRGRGSGLHATLTEGPGSWPRTWLWTCRGAVGRE